MKKFILRTARSASNFLALSCFLLFFTAGTLYAQKDTTLIYHPEWNAEDQLSAAIKQATAENKHVILMIGGNWCRWCRMFEQFRIKSQPIDSLTAADFVWVHINYSKENKNLSLLERLEFPQRFGFPVFVVLDSQGRRLHTQNSAYLESGEGYSEEKVLEFLRQWSPGALSRERYLPK